MAEKKIVFSGIQPSGQLHLGNYLGAIRQWVLGQEEFSNVLCVVDMHAITVPQDPKELREKTREAIGILLACGIDPEKSLLYIQSHVSAHAELTWILNSVTPLGWLRRMTQFKDKSAKQESVSTGLLDYPVLQAADILLFDADLVPTGEDQRQHIELTRDIAIRFNNLFGDTFKLPNPLIPKVGAKVMGFDDPTVKMSKSILRERPHHAVGILDEPNKIRKTIKSAVTDTGREIVFSDAPEKAGVNNLLTLYQVLTGKTPDAIQSHFEGKGYGDLKQQVIEVVVETLRPIQDRYGQLRQDRKIIEEILEQGAAEARSRCKGVLEAAKERVGYILPK